MSDVGRAYIDGEWCEPAGGAVFEVREPATGAVLGTVVDAAAAEARAAVEAAGRALAGWRALPAHLRAEKLRAVGAVLSRRADEIARTMTREQGKPLAEARAEVLSGAEHLLWSAEETRRLYGETVPSTSASSRIWLLPEPVGVVAAITPWNFPLSMVTRKLGPALAAGCPVVLKPSELTPFSALAVAEACAEAGLPPGVVNVVPTTRPAEAAEVFMAAPEVRKVSFTGSTRVGKLLIAASAPDVKRMSVELGGHAPVLVFADADLEKAAAGVARAKFYNAGQACTSPNRIFVHSSVAGEFGRLLAARTAALPVGDGLADGTRIGPLISSAAVDKVSAHVADALGRGARVLTGGDRPTDGPYAGGSFHSPTVLAGVTDEMLVSTEETFGPVAPLLTFESDEEAVARANATPYGLASYLWSRELSRVMRTAEALRFGMVSVNGGSFAAPQGPFGGIKGSGYGREGGHHGVEHYLDYKYLAVELDG
ncbi:NAD-dependent succinate-semialdehyde dehydrogenase [Micromonospora carbonacea]|uniref:NAD-dependent succinate-semialdehyde dehydrogenase n=1 Tax=Micromonospora carbonacea TaxID=47853 RepID=A0A7H8XMN4_9ACTN|nr:NAD-dependent succinate-semialdehyde dehydrogenase [Micromonospora carbonacea]MBB5827332.1 succinate-semialdehyde dehydrogenase/glutarate-semialdehyde dehydrogenase [Micromonospora carbonacea]QLD24891.1 NAD-dependent succinate-semialdehyde dehydrogenase [Micromonospora carbonacea]